MTDNNNEIKDFDILFNKVFRNVYLRRLITEQLLIFKEHKKVVINNISELTTHSKRDYIEKIIYTGEDMIDHGEFPTFGALKSIKLVNQSLSSIVSSTFPSGVKKVSYCSTNSTIETDISSFPSSVTDIRNVFIKHPFTLSLKSINETLPSSTGKLLDLIRIPSNIKRIKFGEFQGELENSQGDDKDLTTTLTDIDFGNRFRNNHKLLKKGNIPIGIKKLKINTDYNGLPIGVLPETLEDFSWTSVINFSLINGVLPPNLTTLYLNFNSHIEIHKDSLPETLINLTIISESRINISVRALPKGLQTLKITNVVSGLVNNNWLPIGLKSLTVTKPIGNIYYYQRLTIHHINIPPSLTHLEFVDRGFGIDDKQILTPGCLGRHLTYLNVGSNFNQQILKGALPHSLTHLNLGVRWSSYHLDAGILPNNLKILRLSDEFNKKLEIGSLPNSITDLTFGFKYNQDLNEVGLPSSLTKLYFSCPLYSYPITKVNFFPPSLTNLSLSQNLIDLISPEAYSNKIENIFYIQ